MPMRVWWLGLALVMSCSFDEEPTFTISNRCDDSSSCEFGMCTDGACVDIRSSADALILEVVRSPDDVAGTAPPNWAFEPENFASSSSVVLTLPPTIDVIGTVRWNGLRVPARISFVRQLPEQLAQIESEPLVVDTMLEPGTTPDQNGGEFDYGAQLAEGARYDVVVEPTNQNVLVVGIGGPTAIPALRLLPPLRFLGDEGLEVDPDSVRDGVLRWNVEFSSGAGTCTVDEPSDCILWGKIVREGPGARPVAGVRVQAVEATPSSSARLVSSIAETSPDGDFVILVGPDNDGYLLQITGQSEDGIFPTIRVLPNQTSQELQVIPIPTAEDSLVGGVVRDSMGGPVANAAVTFSADQDVGSAARSFRDTVMTDTEGRYSVRVLAGSNTVTITPPDGTDFVSASARFAEQMVGAPAATLDFELPQKGQLSGVVNGVDGPGAGVTIEAQSRSSNDASLARSADTVSTETGDFSLSLDPGTYDFVVRPPPSVAHGWIVETDVPIAENDDQTRAYALGLPIVIRGIIRNMNGELVNRASIRAHRIIGSGDGARAIQIGETTSDEEGAYRLYVNP